MVSEQPNRTEAKRHQPRDSLQYREATQDSQSQESSLNPRRNSPRQLSNRMKCSLSENSSSDIGGSGTIKNSQPRSQTPGNTPTSEGNQKNRINLDEVINIMSSRAEINSPLQYMDRGTADAGGNVRSTATKKTSVLPLRIYKELPVVPLAEFKHPDFPSEEMLTQPKPIRTMSWYAIAHVGCFMTLTIAVLLVMIFTDISKPDPSTKTFMEPLPPLNWSI